MPFNFNTFEEKIGKKGVGGTAQGSVVTTSPATSSGRFSFSSFEQATGVKPGVVSSSAPAESGGILKAIVGAPATMIARPFQAAQSLGQVLGSNTEELARLSQQNNDSLMKLIELRRQKLARGEDVSHLDKTIADIKATPDYAAQELGAQGNWKASSGGIVSAAPENWGDVEKDVGRAIQTVALGAGPGTLAASGAAFGIGNSLTEGNDLFSLSTAAQGILGGVGGKLTGLLGKPIFGYSGKIIGIMTPDMIKIATAKGASAISALVEKTMAPKLFGGVAAPLSQGIEKGMMAVDSAVDKGTSALWKGTKAIPGKLYPNAQKDLTDMYVNHETDRLMVPATGPGNVFVDAQQVLADAEKAGVKNARKEVENVIRNSDVLSNPHMADGKFDTKGAGQKMVQDTINNGNAYMTPLLEAANPGIQRTTVDEVAAGLKQMIGASKLSNVDKEAALARLAEEYGVGGANYNAYKNKGGMDMLDFYRLKNNAQQEVFSQAKSGITITSETQKAQFRKMEGDLMKKLMIAKAPDKIKIPGLGNHNLKEYIANYFKQQQKYFTTANYLKAIHNKPMPKSLTSSLLKATARAAGGIAGMKVGGPFGGYLGLGFGSIGADMFKNMPSPLKMMILRSRKIPTAEAYKIMRNYVTDAEFARGWNVTPQLPAGSPVQKQVYAYTNSTKGIPQLPAGSPAIRMAPTVESGRLALQRWIADTKKGLISEPFETWVQKPGNMPTAPNRPMKQLFPGVETQPTTGSIGGVAQAATEPHAVAVARWKFDTKKGLTRDTFETWMKGRTPEGLPPIVSLEGGATIPGETGTITATPRTTAPARVFTGKGPGFQKFSKSIDNLVDNKTLLQEDADILKVLFEGADDKALADVAIRDSGRLRNRPGFFSRKVSPFTGETQPGSAKITLKKGLTNQPVTRADQTPLKVFLHEYGHYSHRLILNKEEQAIVTKVYKEMGKSRADALFRGGLSNPAEGSMTGAKYYAKDENEFIAQSFAEYVLENKIPAKQMKPLLDRLVGKFMAGLKRLIGRGPVPGMEKMTPLFEKMLSGDRSNPLANYMMNAPPSFRSEIQAMLNG